MSPEDDYLLRQRVEASLSRLRAEGQVDDAGEAAVVRHFNERAGELENNLQNLVSEYKRLAEAEGEDAANRWLAQAAHELGKSDGEETRRVLEGSTH